MDQHKRLRSFQELTGCNDEECRFYLDSHNWDVELAASTYFSSRGTQKGMSSPPALFPSRPIESKPEKKPTAPKRTGGIKGFSDLRGDDENEDEDNVNWFTGGEKSGLQVQAPKKNVAEEVMKSAQKLGAKSIDEQKKEDNAAFTGYGYRLGMNASQESKPDPSTAAKIKRAVITFWKDGFTVDDGPLRSLNDPSNAAFINSIQQGRIPPELQTSNYADDIEVEMKDNSGQEYKEPPKVIKPFSGSGMRLSDAPVTSTAATYTPVTTSSSQSFHVDESQPTTSLQIRLHDGTKLTGKFNHTHTIQDIRTFINSSKPASFAYVLMTSFPQKVLTDESQTLKDAGLINSVVIQKAK